ncbi:uncharacterized protein LOC131548720 [Onychostoma macrolepis]|uniref:uncharacterized protein LOC131548720 n=1 Tax=Onychostoma macrolepis TaxID=369639 RepID=UPI00272A73B1|nr:uncharacterized protein LOC131548720 [Onychostoma macrolepis]
MILVSAVLFSSVERRHQNSLEGCRDVFEEELSEPANLTRWDIQIEKKRGHRRTSQVKPCCFTAALEGRLQRKQFQVLLMFGSWKTQGGREAEGMEENNVEKQGMWERIWLTNITEKKSCNSVSQCPDSSRTARSVLEQHAVESEQRSGEPLCFSPGETGSSGPPHPRAASASSARIKAVLLPAAESDTLLTPRALLLEEKLICRICSVERQFLRFINCCPALMPMFIKSLVIWSRAHSCNMSKDLGKIFNVTSFGLHPVQRITFMTVVEAEFRVKVFHRIRIVAPKNCEQMLR